MLGLAFIMPPLYTVVFFFNIVSFVLPDEDKRCFNRGGQMGVHFTL